MLGQRPGTLGKAGAWRGALPLLLDSRALGLELWGPGSGGRHDRPGLGVGGTRKASRQGCPLTTHPLPRRPRMTGLPNPALLPWGRGVWEPSPGQPWALEVLPTCHCHLPKRLFSLLLCFPTPLCPSVCLHPSLSLFTSPTFL